mmetsp:Transcript_7077/g.18320  ORF Transcript_7077/g.18320 Transcript_7077/m.18320 type:complete len:258 (-) Transcript_7077:3400-4173(-)
MQRKVEQPVIVQRLARRTPEQAEHAHRLLLSLARGGVARHARRGQRLREEPVRCVHVLLQIVGIGVVAVHDVDDANILRHAVHLHRHEILRGTPRSSLRWHIAGIAPHLQVPPAHRLAKQRIKLERGTEARSHLAEEFNLEHRTLAAVHLHHLLRALQNALAPDSHFLSLHSSHAKVTAAAHRSLARGILLFLKQVQRTADSQTRQLEVLPAQREWVEVAVLARETAAPKWQASRAHDEHVLQLPRQLRRKLPADKF